MQQQLDPAVSRARKSATHLMRNLLATFFTPEILAETSALGTGAHKTGQKYFECVYTQVNTYHWQFNDVIVI